jgi:iron complex outermembrane receptor protein
MTKTTAPTQNRSLRRKHRLSCLPLLALILAAGHASARTIPDEEASRLSLEELLAVEVYSTSQYVRQISAAPSSASVVTAEEIRAHGYRNLTDVLKSLPGLYVSYDRNYSYLGSRGFGKVGDWNSRVLFMVDGHRVNENVYDGAYIGNDFILDVSLIDRIEYVAGPAAAMLYGNNAFFGAVNVITRSGQQLNGGELSAGIGSADARVGRLNFGKRLDNGLDVLLSASRDDIGGLDLYFPEFGGTAAGLDHERAERQFVKIGFGGFSLELAHAERNKGIPNASYAQVFNDARSQTTDEQSFIDLNYNHPLGGDAAVSGRLYYGRYDYVGDYIYDLAAAPPPEIALLRDGASGRWWGFDLKFVGSNLNGHKLLFGADYQSDLRRDQHSFYLGQAALLDDKRRGQQWGIYAHDEIVLSQRLAFDVGARYDHPSNGDDQVNPRLGLIYQWRPDTTFKALYGSAFRPPNVFELYYTLDALYRPNPDLAPERIKTRELVLDHALGAGQRLIATLFRNDIRDLIDYVPKSGADGLMGTEDDFFRFENAGKVHSTGLELRYEHPLPAGGHLRASYTGQSTRDQEGKPLENSPRHLAKVNWRQPLFGSRLQTGLEIQYVGARRTYAGTQVGGATLTNLTLSSTRLIGNIELSASIYNLFNRRLADPAANFLAPIDRMPLDGREWRLQAVIPF